MIKFIMTTFSEVLNSLNPQLASAINASPWLLLVVILQIVLKIVLYPLALYSAGKKQSKTWFVILFICFLFLNDFGLVALVYLLMNRFKTKSSSNKISQKQKSRRKK